MITIQYPYNVTISNSLFSENYKSDIIIYIFKGITFEFLNNVISSNSEIVIAGIQFAHSNGVFYNNTLNDNRFELNSNGLVDLQSSKIKVLSSSIYDNSASSTFTCISSSLNISETEMRFV